MYVILTAFQGKLKSDPIEWPENTPPEIRLLMDLDLTTQGYLPEALPTERMAVPESKMGYFRKTGYYYFIKDGNTAAEYALTRLS